MFTSKLKSLMAATCLGLLSWQAAMAAPNAVEPRSEPRDLDQIEIIGSQQPNWRQELERSQLKVFELFSELVGVKAFEINCRTWQPAGSRISRTECSPRYLDRIRAVEARTFADSMRMLGMYGAVMLVDPDTKLKHYEPALREKWLEALAHPEFVAAVEEFIMLQQQYEESTGQR